MNFLKHKSFSLLAIAALTGCGMVNEAPTRNQTSPLGINEHTSEIAQLDAQAKSLNSMANELVKKSTGQGAAIGAAVGCGLGLISASGAQKCVTGAVAGGVTGAAIGHQNGKRKVAARVAQVSKQDLSNTLLDANKKLGEIKQSLPEILASQDAELSRLREQKAAKEITQDSYATRVSQIREDRAKLADALMDSADKARISADNLGVAASQGQSGLMWHIGAAKRLEDEAMSTRSQINLL
jgi:hypothetical protein